MSKCIWTIVIKLYYSFIVIENRYVHKIFSLFLYLVVTVLRMGMDEVVDIGMDLILYIGVLIGVCPY